MICNDSGAEAVGLRLHAELTRRGELTAESCRDALLVALDGYKLAERRRTHERVAVGPVRDHFQALLATGLSGYEIADHIGQRRGRVYSVNEPGRKRIGADLASALLAFTVEEALEMADAPVDEVVFERFNSGIPCTLPSRYKPAHIREALARGYGYANVQRYFAVSGDRMKKILEVVSV